VLNQRLLVVFGTRPELIKLAPLVRECRRRADEIQTTVCATGQHRELLAGLVDYFDIRVDLDLDIMRPGQSLADIAARCLDGLDAAIERFSPDYVVAQGDTTTVMAAALAAFFRKTPFVHVEAGLRTGDLRAPWPEEFIRRIASLATTLHCAPTRRAAANLVAEGVLPETICTTGNTVIDSLLWTIARERPRTDHWRTRHPRLANQRIVLITGHRRESFGDGLERICGAIARLAGDFPDVQFVFPVHLNPQVQEPVYRILNGHRNVHLLAPVAYPEFVWLMDRSTLILTDSGGIQEEAPSLGKPVLVMRDTTERPEAVEAGVALLVGTNEKAIIQGVAQLLMDAAEYAKMQSTVNPCGDGNAAMRIVDFILGQRM